MKVVHNIKKLEKIDKYKESQGDDFASLGLFNNIYDKINEIVEKVNELVDLTREI